MAIDHSNSHWSGLRNRITIFSVNAIVLLPLLVSILTITLKSWIPFGIFVASVIFCVVVENVLRMEVSELWPAIRTWLFGRVKDTKAAFRNLQF